MIRAHTDVKVASFSRRPSSVLTDIAERCHSAPDKDEFYSKPSLVHNDTGSGIYLVPNNDSGTKLLHSSDPVGRDTNVATFHSAEHKNDTFSDHYGLADKKPRRKNTVCNEAKVVRTRDTSTNICTVESDISMFQSDLHENDVSFYNFGEFDEEYFYDTSDDECKAEDVPRNNVIQLYDRYCLHMGIVPIQRFRRQLGQKHIDLRHKQLTVADVKAISVALLPNINVHSVDLSGNNVGLGGIKYFSELMKETVYITELNISETKPGVEGLRALTSALQNCRSLRKLDISGNNFDASHSNILAELISNNEYIKDLDLGYNEIAVDGGNIIGPAIGDNVGLTRLSLHWNHLRLSGAVAVCDGIMRNNQLQIVDLSWNGLSELGCRALAGALEKNFSIMELNLACNRIDTKCLDVLMKGVVRSESLRKLNLSQNPIMTQGAILVLSSLQKTPECLLSDVDLGDTNVDATFMELLATLRESRDVRVLHGLCMRNIPGVSKAPRDKKKSFEKYDPMLVLFEYMKQDNMRLVDLFRNFDADKSDTLTRDEIERGFLTVNIPMTEERLDELLKLLDINADGNVDIQELLKGHKKTRRKVTTVKNAKKLLKGNDSEPFMDLKKMIKSALDEKNKNLRMRDKTRKAGSGKNNRKQEMLKNVYNESATNVTVDNSGMDDGLNESVGTTNGKFKVSDVADDMMNLYRRTEIHTLSDNENDDSSDEINDMQNESILDRYRKYTRRQSYLKCVFRENENGEGSKIENVVFIDN